MSETHTDTYKSQNTEDTENFGAAIGRKLKGGETIELISDLGGGKTTLVRGLTKGFGSADRVASPTFTISRVYKKGEQEIHHFDFYRLAEAGVTGHELEEVVGDPNCIVVVEWAQVVEDILPKDRLQISIEQSGEDSRRFTLRYPASLAYLLPQEETK